ncbi:MAG TPA: hypothetical protein VF516_10100 [Kofleriaceae bacterium]
MRMATRIAAPARTARSAWRGPAWALVCGAAIGCTASGSDIELHRDELAFPTGVKVSPDGKALFVVNANSELRFDSGSLDVIALDRVQRVISEWTTYLTQPSNTPDPCNTFAQMTLPPKVPDPGGGNALDCKCDPDNAATLGCEESYFINTDAGVKLGNFATDLSIQDFSAGATTHLRVFVPSRGDPSIAWADFDGTALHCTAGSNSYQLCDDAHRLTSLNNDPNLEVLPNEPFAVFADVVHPVDAMGKPLPLDHTVAPQHGFAMVTHLASGAVTLIDAPADGPVQIADILQGVFGDPSTAARGATSVAGLPMQIPASPAPGAGPELAPETLYVASDTDNRVQQFSVGMRAGAADYLLPGRFFVLSAVGETSGSSVDSRGLRFSADGTRLYLVNRTPPSLQVYDTSIGPDGTPNNRLLGSSDLCREGSAAAVAGAGTDERVYVTCFDTGQVYVVNPFGQSQVEDIITVGRGPYAADVLSLAASPTLPPPTKFLFVSNFLEDTIAVIDIDPSSPTRNRVVLRIGQPRPQ